MPTPLAARAFLSPSRGLRWATPLAVAATTTALGHAAAIAYTQGPPPAHTGGFGEPTCHLCHFDQPLNDPAGSLRLEGLPEAYAAGARYTLVIGLERAGLRRAGTELAVRFVAGPRRGAQAGHLKLLDDRLEVVVGEPSAIAYARQTLEGSHVDTPDRARWSIEWIAPGPDAEAAVVFHLAANAANDDASELGDYVYTAEYRIPAQTTPP